MLLNNIKKDVRIKLAENELNQTQLATALNITPQYLGDVINGRFTFVNNKFLEIMEELGYDIRLEYVPKDNNKDDNDGDK